MRLSSLSEVKVLAAILAVIILPVIATLYTVQEPKQIVLVENVTPFGYTVSLLIYAVPIAAIYWWFRRTFRDDGFLKPTAHGLIRRVARDRKSRLRSTRSFTFDYRRIAYRWTLLVLISIGWFLDVVFGYAFLTFDNPDATIGILLPSFSLAHRGFVSYLPVEEFAFYTLGFVVILSLYIWCDEYWLFKYNVDDYALRPDVTNNRGLPPFIAQAQLRVSLFVSVGLIGAALLYKKFGPHDAHAGFPSYFTFLVLASLFPSMLLLKSTRRFINWQACSFVVFSVLLTSLIWEVTLAAPYDWWGYKDRHMMGLFVDAWYGLPVEAVLLWVSVTFTTVMVYEAFKILNSIKGVTGATWLEALIGVGKRPGEWLRESIRS